jgi:glucose-1-phosphate thymidylyltransferase
MKAVIPVAGEGTRLRPHTHTVPKPLLRVAGKPILGHIFDDIVALGIKDIVLVVGYRGQDIVDYVNANYDVRVSIVEQGERLGLGHAIYLTRDLVADAPVLIMLGDSIFKADLRGMVDSQENCIGVTRVDEPQRFGVVELDDSRIVGLVEKPEQPKTNLAIVGVYCLRDSRSLYSALSRIVESGTRTKGEFQLTDALNLMMKEGVVLKAFSIEGWYDCGKPETLLDTNRALLDRAAPQVNIPGSIVIPPVHVGGGAIIESSVIGPHVSVAENSQVRRSVVRNSIIGENAVVEDALLEASLVGDNAVVRGKYKRLNVGDSSEIDFT